MFIVALFTIARTCMQLKCPSTEEWIKKMSLCVYIHIRTYIYTCVYTHVCTHIHMCIYICVYIHIHTYVCMYIYTHDEILLSHKKTMK